MYFILWFKESLFDFKVSNIIIGIKVVIWFFLFYKIIGDIYNVIRYIMIRVEDVWNVDIMEGECFS